MDEKFKRAVRLGDEYETREEAIGLLRELMDEGHVDAFAEYASMLIGEDQDAEGLALLEDAENKGSVLAKAYIGLHRMTTGDAERGLKKLVEAADLGNGFAQFAYGSALLEGTKEVEKDVGRGLEYIRKSADGGYAEAQTELGVILKNGDEDLGVEPNVSEGVAYLERAAEQGAKWALQNLGHHYKDLGDRTRALEYFYRARDAGLGYAVCVISKMGSST